MTQNDTMNIPRSFYCPLTMEVMVDPVIDMQGIAYEKKAILQWLSHHGISPVSRQPLNSNLLIPNIALRDTIHEIMGAAWVTQRTEEVREQYNCTEMEDKSDRSNCDFAPSCKYRGRMQCYLTKLAQEVGGSMELELDDSGVCMFSCENMTIVVEVPADAGIFYIYTAITVPTLSEETKDMMLELNRLQSETRGGVLSMKKHENGTYDIYFSYSDRINEISAADFCNIVPNFIETAARLRAKFVVGEQRERRTPQTRNTSTSNPTQENAYVGMAAKFV